MFEHLVVHRFVLDFASLITCFHRAEHTASFGNTLKFFKHCLFDQIGQLINDEAALIRILILGQTPFVVNNQLNRKRPTHRLCGGRGDRLVISIRVQRIRLIVGCNQRLQGGAYIVECDFLGMQRAARGLAVILQFLRTFISTITITHRHSPNPTRYATNDGVLRVHTVGEEKAQIRCEIIDMHATRQISFNKRKAIGEREGKLRDRISPRLSNVIARYRDRIKIAHTVLNKIGLNITHHLERKLGGKNTGILSLILFKNIGLYRTA